MSIRIHVDAIVTLTDGFTGKPIESAAAVVNLDGRPHAPVRKPGGTLAFVNLPAGQHEIVVHVPHFQPESIALTADGESTAQLNAMLSPDRRYPLPAGAVRLSGTMRLGKEPLRNAKVLFSTSAGALKLAQDEAKAGDRTLTLFAARGALRLPAVFMFTGGKSEQVRLLSAEGALEAPLRFAHKRGEALVPVRELTTDEGGGYYLCLPQQGEVTFYYPAGEKWLACPAVPDPGGNAEKEIVFTK